MRLGKTEENEIHRFCFLETNDDMRLGKTREILVQASPEFSTTAMTYEPMRLCCLIIHFPRPGARPEIRDVGFKTAAGGLLQAPHSPRHGPKMAPIWLRTALGRPLPARDW